MMIFKFSFSNDEQSFNKDLRFTRPFGHIVSKFKSLTASKLVLVHVLEQRFC